MTKAFEYVLTVETNDAAQVRACQELHGLTSDQVRREISGPTPSGGGSPPAIGQEFLECEWPPPDYADADGYSQIRSLKGVGPGESEASGATALDRITATCHRMELGYSFGTQGFDEDLEPFVAEKGDVVHARGGVPWESPRPYPYPERDEVVVVRDLDLALEAARCVNP